MTPDDRLLEIHREGCAHVAWHMLVNQEVRYRNRLRVGDGLSETVVGAPMMVESRLKRFDQDSSVGPLRMVVQLDCGHVSKLL